MNPIFPSVWPGARRPEKSLRLKSNFPVQHSEVCWIYSAVWKVKEHQLISAIYELYENGETSKNENSYSAPVKTY
jgi:hypothetical protein